MNSRLSWIALGVGAYLAFIISTFPAAVAARWFAPDNVTLASPSGTLWSGRAAAASLSGMSVDEIRWQISPWMLALGRVAGDLAFRVAEGFADTTFTLRPGGRIDLADTRLSTSIEELGRFISVYGTRGQISANLEMITIENGWPVRATGEIRVGALEVPPFISDGTNSRIQLGDFRAVVSVLNEGNIGAELTDLDGPLELDGQLTLNSDRSYLVSGKLRARPGASPDLIQGVNLMASEPDAGGMREITFSGSL